MSCCRVAIFLVVVAAGLVGHGLGQDEQCVATLQAHEGSPWRNLGKGDRKVPLSSLKQLVDKNGLTLVGGSPPPHAAHALMSMTCERLGPMWVGLPDPSATLADETNTMACKLDNMKDKVSTLLGFKRDTPKQYPGQPRRVYMQSYCGLKFPVSTKSEVAQRMHENTRRLERKMNSWQK